MIKSVIYPDGTDPDTLCNVFYGYCPFAKLFRGHLTNPKQVVIYGGDLNVDVALKDEMKQYVYPKIKALALYMNRQLLAPTHAMARQVNFTPDPNKFTHVLKADRDFSRHDDRGEKFINHDAEIKVDCHSLCLGISKPSFEHRITNNILRTITMRGYIFYGE